MKPTCRIISVISRLPNNARSSIRFKRPKCPRLQPRVDYLFIGKSAALLLGYPGTTQDMHVIPARSAENGRRIVAALRKIGFDVDASLNNRSLQAKTLCR